MIYSRLYKNSPEKYFSKDYCGFHASDCKEFQGRMIADLLTMDHSVL